MAKPTPKQRRRRAKKSTEAALLRQANDAEQRRQHRELRKARRDAGTVVNLVEGRTHGKVGRR